MKIEIGRISPMRNIWIAGFCLSLLAIGTNAGTGLFCLGCTEPAAAWTDALPVGNGSLGAMVFGGVATEWNHEGNLRLVSMGRNYLPNRK